MIKSYISNSLRKQKCPFDINNLSSKLEKTLYYQSKTYEEYVDVDKFRFTKYPKCLFFAKLNKERLILIILSLQECNEILNIKSFTLQEYKEIVDNLRSIKKD
jgi:hypothetical protein